MSLLTLRWAKAVLLMLCVGIVPHTMAAIDRSALDSAVQKAGELSRTHTLLVAIDGETVIDRGWRGHATDETANIKSLSKLLISALVGIAIERDIIAGVDQPVVELLDRRVPGDVDHRVNDITVGHLLSMQAGLERTSGANYAGWVASDNWVRDALTRPMVGEPGGRMRYSTGNSHLLSAALTEASGRSTLALMRDWLGEPLGIAIPAWTRDPQGIYFGGNEMSLTPQALLRLAELYRQQGKHAGEQVLTAEWIERSWAPRTRSVFNQDLYGYGWFRTELDDTTVHYGWGYGGQLLFVIPARNMTIIMTSDPTPPSNGSTYLEQAKAVVERMIAAVEPS
ncbi:serine hydrolase domain-containing protein [Aidingimonas lacisalsi]|uniref:serine hydrolase domain-containing protein n=1 Tax=Aidingimonas lacisalsi TaxID=2604086 RepID=UPI0011D2B39B|nr:serine hydrolase [Aidingimonas lacisalsi]